ncbi:histidine phosphatase family protein [Aliishimia ponticola]|uniref:Histidine phosphatase family protein n=1 Tax=Aliishimia ponticola TaxID=2499833 RepID=A0A4S4ND68_9RHOB|nr:histidine phosphatase family protein [Aliishimia ponticola]THH36705.1 histidine phosphatase family protein [Aliishimia ponticola]
MGQEYRQPVYAPPAGAADLLLVRHGESEPARPGQSFAMKDGHGDPALHPQGERQAERVGERLRHAPIRAIYVTKLRRTHQTAAPLAGHLGLVPVEDPDLHEVHLGDWDGGLYRIKAAERDPAYQRAIERQDWGEIPNAERREAFFERVRRGIMRVAEAHSDQQVAVVVHGGVIAAALAIATGSEPFAFHGAANGSISRIVVQDGRMNVRGFNDISHLDGL